MHYSASQIQSESQCALKRLRGTTSQTILITSIMKKAQELFSGIQKHIISICSRNCVANLFEYILKAILVTFA